MVPLHLDSQNGPTCNPVLLVVWVFFFIIFFLRNEIAEAFSSYLPS